MAGKRKRSDQPAGSPEKKAKLQNPSAQKRKTFSTVGTVKLDDGESTPFPRGGQESLTPLEKRVIHQQVKQDVLFNEGGDEEKDKTPLKKRAKVEPDSSQGKRGKFLNIMSAKKLLPGAVILGAVLEVHEFEVIVSLPFNLRGSVAISDVSDQLSQRLATEAETLELEEESEGAPGSPSLSALFTRGQLLTCYVLAVDGGRVSLSINPRLVNAPLTQGDIKPGMILPGSVKSVEDHGYIIDFSIEDKTGFLLKRNAMEVVKGKGKSLSLGQVVACLVLQGADARAVPVSVNPTQVTGSLLSGDTLIGVNALLPGVLVNSAVKEVGINGLMMSFLGGLEGTVSTRHLQNPGELTTDKYHLKKKFKARILWVDVATKTAGLTLQKQIVSGSSFAFEGLEVGDTFGAAKVVHIDRSKGLYLELGNDIMGYAPSWMLVDEKDKTAQELTKSTHRTGTIHTCRLVQFNLLDGCPIVSLQPSVIEKPYMRYSDLSVGEAVEGKVERFGEFGMIVGLTDMIRGLCTRTHLSDTRAIMKQPRKKYKEGSKVKARVLSVDPTQNRLLLTCKKSLIRDSCEPLTCYTQATPGDVRQGVILSLRGFGCIVGFFNGVRGIVLKSELGLDKSVLDISSILWAGQPVECRVLECDADKQRLLLSLRMDNVAAVSVAGGASVKVEGVVNAEVTGIASNGINLKCCNTGEVLFLPTLHLSDHTHHCAHLLSMHQAHLEKCVKKGKSYILEGLLVLSERATYKPAQVTLKRALALHSQDTGFIKELTAFKVGTIQPGVVKKLMPYGCFIEFPHQLSGLAPTKYLTNEFVSGPAGLYQEMQTVWSKVMQIDDVNGKLLLSLRPSDLKSSNTLEEDELTDKLLALLSEFLEERDVIVTELVKSSGSMGSALSALAKDFVPGSTVTGHVTSVGDHVTIDVGSGVTGRASAQTANGNTVDTGAEVTGTVLDIDLVECCLVVSLNQGLLLPTHGRVLRSASKSKRKSIASEIVEPKEATVEYKTTSHFMLSYEKAAGRALAYGVMDSGQLGVLPTYFKDIKVGQKVSTTTLSRAEGSGAPLPVLLMKEPSMAVSGGEGESVYNVKAGDIINVKVHSMKATQVDVRYHLMKGRIHATLCENVEKDCDDVIMTSPRKRGISVLRGVKVGDQLQARVVRIKARQIEGLVTRKGATLEVLELTTKPSLMDPAVEMDGDSLLKKSYSVGEEVAAVITQGQFCTELVSWEDEACPLSRNKKERSWEIAFTPHSSPDGGFTAEVKDSGLQVALNPRAEGFVPVLLTSDHPDQVMALKNRYSRGQVVRCTVLGCESGKGHVHNLSMIGVVEPSEGCVVLGRVNQVIPGQALLVSTPVGNGRVDITDLSDSYVNDPLSAVAGKGEFVRCCLVGIAENKLDFSMRASRTGAEGVEPDGGSKECEVDPEIESISDLTKNQLLRGYIKAVTDVGIFVRLGRSVDGRVKITHLSDGFIKNFKKHFTLGKLVKAKVLNIDAANNKVDLSMRLSHVDPKAAKKVRKKQEKEISKKRKKTTEKMVTSDGESIELESAESSSEDELVADESDSEESEVEDVSSDENDEGKSSVTVNKPTLRLSGGFQWGVVKSGEDATEKSSESETEEKEAAPKKTKRQKKAALKAEEAHLYQTEQACLTENKEPQGPDDFDRLVLASPNDSALWVKYMSFFLHTTEVDKARSIAQRALKTIGFREEKEKLNVWVGWMNLENLYGSQESLVKVFESALRENEPLDVFTRLVAIYQQSQKFDLADQLYQSMTKRFGKDPQVWTQYGEFLMRREKRQAARGLLQRSLKSLARKQDHLVVIQKFAILEFKLGEPERAITMFESLLSTYPRRIDIWSTYIDQMIKLGNAEPVRSLFERVIHLSVSVQKMKFFFKRYLEFEGKYGSAGSVEEVKMKAREYVETRSKKNT